MGTTTQDKDSLFNRRFAIDQTPAPTTPAARALTLQENAKRHKIYTVDYSIKKRGKHLPPSPTTHSASSED